MKNNEIPRQAATTILDEPLVLTVDMIPQNRLQKYLIKRGWMQRIKTFEIAPIVLGNLIRISELLLSMDIDFKEKNVLEVQYQIMYKHSKTVATIIAIAIQNNRHPPEKWLIRFILQNFTAKEMMNTMGLIVNRMDMTSFLTTIISIKGMSVLESGTADVMRAEEKEMSL